MLLSVVQVLIGRIARAALAKKKRTRKRIVVNIIVVTFFKVI